MYQNRPVLMSKGSNSLQNLTLVMVRKIEFSGKPGKFACWLSKDEVKFLIEQCTDTQDQQIILTLLASGLRVHEATNAKSEDIFEDSTRGLMLKVYGKGKNGRKKYRECPIPARLKHANLPITRMYNGKHRPISTNTALNWVKKAGLKMNCPELSCHDLRRSYASILLETGVSNSVILEWLGWSSWETFRKYYMNIANPDFQKAERLRVDFLN